MTHEQMEIVEPILQSKSISFWLKDAYKSAMSRDPIDAERDAEELHYLMKKRSREVFRIALGNHSNQPTVYLAGPDVFRVDWETWSNNAKIEARKNQIRLLTPSDNESHDCTAKGIVDSNLRLIDQSDIVIANLNPFRGNEPDSGTVFEIAYAYANKKTVIGYIESEESQITRLEKAGLLANGTIDAQGYAVEDFNKPLNIMITETIDVLVIGNVEKAMGCAQHYWLRDQDH